MSEPENSSFNIDPSLVRKAGARAHRRGADAGRHHIPDVIADRLFERLTLLKMTPGRVLDLGTGDGRHLDKLRELFPRADIIGADICLDGLRLVRRQKFWHRKPSLVCLDASESLPFADGCFDLVVSNLMLPWVLPAETIATELNRVLSESGVFFLSSAGPDTLRELRIAWQQVDSAEHVNAFLDMHDLGDQLQRVGIADPVMDTERLRVTFPSVDKLLNELVNTGCTNVVQGRRRGLAGSDIRKRLAAHYPVEEAGVVAATLEIVYAHGWKGNKRTAKQEIPGEYRVSIDDLGRPPR